jgi:hypothetical protein
VQSGARGDSRGRFGHQGCTEKCLSFKGFLHPCGWLGIVYERWRKVLEQPISDEPYAPTFWTGRTETASRVRGRIETVLDWARAKKLRDGENPTRWKGLLDKLLPPKSRVAPVGGEI